MRDFQQEIANEIDRQYLEECNLFWPSDLFWPLVVVALVLTVVCLGAR